jgi:hypothetical protein
VKNWFEIAGQGDENHYKFHAGLLSGSRPCVATVRSFKGVWFYAAKYIGKTFEVAEWGSTWTGRFWGVVKPENIPFGAKLLFEVQRRMAVDIMRYGRRFTHQKRNNTSMVIFCDADYWIQRLVMEPLTA